MIRNRRGLPVTAKSWVMLTIRAKKQAFRNMSSARKRHSLLFKNHVSGLFTVTRGSTTLSPLPTVEVPLPRCDRDRRSPC